MEGKLEDSRMAIVLLIMVSLQALTSFLHATHFAPPPRRLLVHPGSLATSTCKLSSMLEDACRLVTYPDSVYGYFPTRIPHLDPEEGRYGRSVRFEVGGLMR